MMFQLGLTLIKLWHCLHSYGRVPIRSLYPNELNPRHYLSHIGRGITYMYSYINELSLTFQPPPPAPAGQPLQNPHPFRPSFIPILNSCIITSLDPSTQLYRTGNGRHSMNLLTHCHCNLYIAIMK